MNKLVKYKILGIFMVFILCVLFHFLYKLSPNTLFSIIFPVNESIWEHMKLIFSSFIIYGIIEYFLIKEKVKFNNYLLNLFLVPTIGIILYLILYIPLFLKFNENIFISIGLLIFIIIIAEITSYYLLTLPKIKNSNIIGFIGIILGYAIFCYLTYNPLKNFIFYDFLKNIYGLK